MKWVKSWKLFREALEVEPTDEPDVKASKDELNELESDISEFKSKKAQIDNAFKTITDDKALKTKLDSIIGTDDKNNFLSQWVHVSTLQKKVDDLTKEITKDKLTKDDFNRELAVSKDPTIKAAVNSKITDISNRIAQKSLKIKELGQEILDSEKEIQKDMGEEEKELKDNIQKMEQDDKK